MVLTRERKKKKEKKKNYTSNQKRKRCEFRAKIPAFYRRLQLAAPLRRHSTRKVFSKCFSHKKCEKHLGNWSGIVSFVLLSMKKTVESRQNNSGRWESERDVSSSCDFF